MIVAVTHEFRTLCFSDGSGTFLGFLRTEFLYANYSMLISLSLLHKFAYYKYFLSMEAENILALFGLKVKELRKEQGLSQEKLAELANLHRTYIGMIERGEKNITLLNMAKIAKALNIEMCNLLKF